MNNMAKNWKSILFYILIPVLLIGAVWYLSSNQSGTEVQYSQVVQMFEENQVKDFSLDLSSGALTYKTFKDPEKEQRYTVPNERFAAPATGGRNAIPCLPLPKTNTACYFIIVAIKINFYLR